MRKLLSGITPLFIYTVIPPKKKKSLKLLKRHRIEILHFIIYIFQIFKGQRDDETLRFSFKFLVGQGKWENPCVK